MDKYGFIYITTNKINNKRYIGKRTYTGSWNKYVGSGKILKKAILKYGKENFERIIIDYANDVNELNDKEIFWINFYDAVNSCYFYNLKNGGEGGNGLKGEFHHYYNIEPPNKNHKIIICENLKTNTKIEFTDIKKFANENNLSKPHISSCLNNKRPSHRECLFYYKSGERPENINLNDTTPIIQENIQTGNKIKITNVSKFCEENNLTKGSIYNCLKGKYLTYFGHIYYREGNRYELKEKRIYRAKNITTGEIYSFESVSSFCKINNLTESRVYACINGAQKSRTHKEYMFYDNEIILSQDTILLNIV